VQRVLSYPHVARRSPLSNEAIEQYLTLLRGAAVFVDLPEVVPAVISDPDDDPILIGLGSYSALGIARCAQ
jgi:hypothetical protein